MWLRGFDFVVIEGEGGRKNQRGNRWTQGRAEGGGRKEEPAGKPLGVGMSGGRKGGKKNQRGNRWAWGRAEEGREEKEPAGKPLDVGTSGERGA